MDKTGIHDVIQILYMQGEIVELRKRVDEFEHMFNKAQNESKDRLKQVEESQLKLAQLQTTHER